MSDINKGLIRLATENCKLKKKIEALAPVPKDIAEDIHFILQDHWINVDPYALGAWHGCECGCGGDTIDDDYDKDAADRAYELLQWWREYIYNDS